MAAVEPERIGLLKRQLQLTWSLAESALDGLSNEEALWVPSTESWTVRQEADGRLTDADLSSDRLTKWPYSDGQAFAFVAGWVNIELMKNVAEMCAIRRSTPFYAAGKFATQDARPTTEDRSQA